MLEFLGLSVSWLDRECQDSFIHEQATDEERRPPIKSQCPGISGGWFDFLGSEMLPHWSFVEIFPRTETKKQSKNSEMTRKWIRIWAMIVNRWFNLNLCFLFWAKGDILHSLDISPLNPSLFSGMLNVLEKVNFALYSWAATIDSTRKRGIGVETSLLLLLQFQTSVNVHGHNRRLTMWA